MPKVRIFVVSKGVQLALFGIFTAVILMLTLFMEGHSDRMLNTRAFSELRFLLRQFRQGNFFHTMTVTVIVTVLLNFMLFYFWATYLFRFLWNPNRHAVVTFFYTVMAGIGLSVAIEIAQLFIPARATDVNDLIYNSAGVLCGALAALLGKLVRVEFK